MKNVLKFLSYVLVAALASALTLFTVPKQEIPSVKVSKLDQLENLIEQRFIGESDKTVMEDAAAEAMIASLGDRWSHYISAADYAAHMESMNNSYVGVGITIMQEEGLGFYIDQVTPGGPAEEAGILPGDIITAIEGEDASGMDTTGARNLVRGEAGTQVLLTILRDGAQTEFSVERRQIDTPVATGSMLDDGIGLIRIVNFDERCYKETLAAIEDLLTQGAKALIFDVRFNPGGYKNELVALLDYLLPAGPLFHSELYNGKTEVDMSDEKCLDIPMAVIVNADSYSAAEFFAAALSEYDRAIVVGVQTCGKGYFQNTIQLNDGSAVGLSVGKYTTPNGVSLAGVGITPDVVVEVDDDTLLAIYRGNLSPDADPQILAAVEALKIGK